MKYIEDMESIHHNWYAQELIDRKFLDELSVKAFNALKV